MKINRLMEITILLLNKKMITAGELAERFGVSVRTIYRDIDVLSSAGVPVYMTKGQGGGISLLEDFALSRTLLSDRESESLLLALKTMQAARYPEIDGVLEKVGAIFKGGQDSDWVKIDFAGWNSFPNERNKFSDIRSAIFDRRLIEFDYINASGEKSRHRAEPESFYFNVRTWYLTAFCLLKNERRIFRLSRIKNVRVLDENFKKRAVTPARHRRAQDFSRPLVRLKLRFSPQILHRLYDEFDENLMRVEDDGSVLVDVVFPEDEWVYGFILSFGASVEVLEPPRVRELIKKRLGEALAKYENDFSNMTNSCHETVLQSEHHINRRNKDMQIEMTSQTAQHSIFIRERVTLDGMTAAFDKNFGKLAAYLAELGEELAGPPYAAYYNSDVNDMDTEFGFPVAKPLPEKGEIKAGGILAFEKAISVTHKGGYDTLHQAYDLLYKKLADDKLTMVGPHYDFYISDPENTNPDEILTKVVLPVSEVPMVFCQSCGMPLTDEMKGTEADGSKSEDYCSYCYKDGKFVQDITMEDMIEINLKYLDQWNPSMTQDEGRAQLKMFLPSLKRWA